MRNEKKYFIGIVGLIVLSVPFLSFVQADKEYSDMELKSKLSRPEIDSVTFFDGTYYSQMETYYLDQMFMRDQVVNFKAQLEKQLGVKQRNGVIFGKEGHLLPVMEISNPIDYVEDRQQLISEIVTNMKRIYDIATDKGMDVIRLDGFEKSDVYDSYYPYSTPNNQEGISLFRSTISDQLRAFGLQTVSMKEHFNKGENTEYYYTDHHFNIYGAVTAFNAMIDNINSNFDHTIDKIEVEDLDLKVVDKMFSGSYSRLLGDKELFNYEKQIIPNLDLYPNFERYELGESVEPFLISNTEITSYGNIMGGDKANTIIKTNRPDLPNVLFIGDSFTNSLELLSVLEFNEVHSIDPRHFKGSVFDYVEENNLDIVVLVNTTLFSDQYIGGGN